MKRRHLIGSVALGAGSTAAIAACGGQTASTHGSPTVQTDDAPQIQWRMASSYTPSLDTVYGGSEYFGAS